MANKAIPWSEYSALMRAQLAEQQMRWDKGRLPPWKATATMSAYVPSTALIDDPELPARKAPLHNPRVDLQRIASQISYKPGSRVEAIEYDGIYLRIAVSCEAIDVNTFEKTRINSGEQVTAPLPLLTEELVVREIYACFIKLELHEAGEYFNFRGARVFDPHAIQERWPDAPPPIADAPPDYNALTAEAALYAMRTIIDEQP